MRSSLPKRTRANEKAEDIVPLPLHYAQQKPVLAAPEKGSLHTIIDDVKGLLLIAAAIFILMTNLFPQTTGMVGQLIVSNLLLPLVGRGMYLLPLFIALWGLLIIMRQHGRQATARKIGVVLGFMTFITIAEIFRSGPLQQFALPQDSDGGGIIGYAISFGLQKVFGPTGTYIFLLVMSLASLLLLLNAPLYILRSRIKTMALEKPRMERSGKIRPLSPEFAHIPVPLPGRASKDKMFGALKNIFGGEKKMIERPMVRSRPQIVQQHSVLAAKKRVPITLNNNSNYKLPPLTLLQEGEFSQAHYQKLVVQSKEDSRVLEATLASFKIDAKVVNVSFGPVITRYELQPGAGIRVSKIASLADDIALSLAVQGVRIEAPVPGKSVVGIEVPNAYARTVALSQMLKTPEFQNSPSKLLFALGQDIGGKPVFGDIGHMPHLLIAGATGSGKSVCLNGIIMSILFRSNPDEVKFLMIDPKRVELSAYNQIPHLVAPVIHEPDMAAAVLKYWALKEMRRRYDLFARVGVKDITRYNQFIEKRSVDGPFMLLNKGTGEEEPTGKMPYIIIVIDELADLMMVASREVEMTVCRLAQLARATGIHLVIATQRPSVDVITGLIKANIPSRIAFAVQSQIDSRTILDGMGAEKLLGRGDMLYSPVGFQKMVRLQGVYVADREIHAAVRMVRAQGKPQYVQEIMDIKPVTKDDMMADLSGTSDGKDPLFEQAAQIVSTSGKQSISYLQRKLRIGYNRAARLMEELQEAGLAKAPDGGMPPPIV